MKKPTLVILALATLILVACNNKTGEKTATTEAPQIETPKEDNHPDEVEKPVSEKPYVIASIRKTPCYGKCPVFKAEFYTDGRATYEGKMNVDRIGNYTGRIDEATLKSIKSKALELGYLDLNNEYPTGDVKIADLPTTITSVRIGDMIKTVSNKYQGPEELKTFEKFLAELADRIDWTKSPGDSNK